MSSMRNYVHWVATALILVFVVMAVVSPKDTRRPVNPSKPVVVSGPVFAPSVIELSQYLPENPAKDGSVDYTARVQAAIDAAEGGALRLPPFPVLVSPLPHKKQCLLVDRPIQILGGPTSELRTDVPAVQLLRVESTSGVLLDGFSVVGVGGVGYALGHGLVQVWNCSDVEVRGLRITDADADAIAIANTSNVRVLGCTVRRGSKAGIYITACDDVVVDGNVVLDTVGHVASGGQSCGAGILLLSNVDLVCSSNVVDRGVGVGIECGSNDRQRAPDGNSIVGNRVRGFSNPANPATSSGIHLANAQPEHDTHVLVASNSIRDCGAYSIFVENHDGAVVQGNTIRNSQMSSIVVGHSRAAVVVGNTFLDGNTARANGQACVYFHADTSDCIARDNVSLTLKGVAGPLVIDRAPVGANRVE